MASFESRARLERFLLMRLERYGEEALGELLGGLSRSPFQGRVSRRVGLPHEIRQRRPNDRICPGRGSAPG